MQTWLNIDQNSDFSIHNLPYGVFNRDESPTPGVAIGDYIIDLRACSHLGVFDDLEFDKAVFDSEVLNDFIGTGKSNWSEVRKCLQSSLCDTSSILHEFKSKILVNRIEAEMLMPIQIGDYTDFYSSIEHATNVGKMFRPDNPLLPNWKHIPVGYHGRSSSIVISGTDLKRPYGQTLPPDSEQPVYGLSKRVDLELEMGFIIGKASKLGDRVNVQDAENHIFGKVIFNDWSARDIQKWEYVPLGPFLGKNFGSTMSAWIVTMEALEPFRCESVTQDPKVLPYLQYEGKKNFDINLEVDLINSKNAVTTICKSNFKYMYWNMAQQIAHHTVNGCNLNIGDLMASGTISGKEKGSYGSMLELSWGGKEKILLSDGSERTFIEDGDTIVIRAYCEKDGKRVGFGSCEGKIIPNS